LKPTDPGVEIDSAFDFVSMAIETDVTARARLPMSEEFRSTFFLRTRVYFVFFEDKGRARCEEENRS